jgi:hypothetical protein
MKCTVERERDCSQKEGGIEICCEEGEEEKEEEEG